MHWAESVAKKLLERGSSHVIETGTSISGIPHIGNASDVIRGDAVRKSLESAGMAPKLIWVSDDSDPLRKIPKGLEAIKDYLGFPVKDIPDPFGCHGGFVEHFVEPFIEDLSALGVKPERFSGTELYRSGALYGQIKIALDRSNEIAEILNKFRREPLSPEFIPWNPICESCGKISTTRAVSREGDVVSYVCEDTEVSGGHAAGCGFKGESDIKKGFGKMPWRVEWAARWAHFKVTCEPLGKEHASAGGSYWTSRIVCEKIFGWTPPEPVIYEFFTLNGAKISSSKGNVITLSDWLKIAEPEVLKFFMYKRLQKQRDINLKTLPALVDEYDNAEKAYSELGGGEADPDLLTQYGLSQVGDPAHLAVPFTLCAVLAQIVPELDLSVIEGKLGAQGYSGFDLGRLLRRLELAREWNLRYGPEYLRFELCDLESAAVQRNALSPEQQAGLAKVSQALDDGLSAPELHKQIYEIARGEDIAPPKLFEAIYLVLIGKKKGPKAAAFLLTLGSDFVRSRFSL